MRTAPSRLLVRYTTSGILAVAGLVLFAAPGLAAAPVLTSAVSTTPPIVASGPAFSLQVNGTGFVNGVSVVRWNGADRVTHFVGATQIYADIPSTDIPAGPATTAAVTVYNAPSLSNTITVSIGASMPSISSLSPSSKTVGQPDFPLIVNGSAFLAPPDSVIRVNGVDHATVMTLATQLRATVTAAEIASVGTLNVTVRNNVTGEESNVLPLSVVNPVPAIASLAPSSVVVGSPDVALVVNGSGFYPGSGVKWNGADRATSYISPTQLSITVPASDLVAVGAVSVTVVNAAPGGGTTAPASFSVVNGVPTIASLSPATALVGGGSLTLTVNGSNFVGASVAKWNGADRATSYISPSQLTVAILAGDVAAVGTFPVTVTNPAPGGGVSAGSDFNVDNGAPAITSLSPTSAVTGSPGFVLTVNGSNFVGTSVAKWNGSNRTTTYVGPTQLSVSITAGDVAAVGTFPVTVTNPAPGGGTSSAVSFSVADPVPVISGLSPNNAQAGSGSFTLTVNGSNFKTGAIIKWNGGNRTTVFVNATKLTATIPSSDIVSAGTYPVTVVNPDTQVSAPSTFTANAVIMPTGAINNVTGWLWSGTAGWISLNCSNFGTCATSDYGVNLDYFTTGVGAGAYELTGWGWSETFGWICFGKTCPDDVKNPEGSLKNYADLRELVDDGTVEKRHWQFYGWARVMNMGNKGWVSLNCYNINQAACGANSYYVSFDIATGFFSNVNDVPNKSINHYGWSGNDDGTGIGWVDFSLAHSNWAPPIIGPVVRPQGIYEPAKSPLPGVHPSEFTILLPHVSSPKDYLLECVMKLPNGDRRYLSRIVEDTYTGFPVKFIYQIPESDRGTSAIQPNKLWYIETCRLLGTPSGQTCTTDDDCVSGLCRPDPTDVALPKQCRLLADSTLPKPIFVHDNRWTLYGAEDDFYRAVKCYASFSDQFFQNGNRCDFTADAAFSMAMSKGIPVERDCNNFDALGNPIDDDGNGEANCDDRFCKGISYFCKPEELRHPPTRCVWSETGDRIKKCDDMTYQRGDLCCSDQPVVANSDFHQVVNGLECEYGNPLDGYFDCDCNEAKFGQKADCFAPGHQPGEFCCEQILSWPSGTVIGDRVIKK